MCVRINRRDIGRSATLQRPSVGLGNRRRRGLEGRGTRPDSRPDHCLPLGVVGWPPRSREMRRTVCSVEPVFWPMRGMGCGTRVLRGAAPSRTASWGSRDGARCAHSGLARSRPAACRSFVQCTCRISALCTKARGAWAGWAWCQARPVVRCACTRG